MKKIGIKVGMAIISVLIASFVSEIKANAYEETYINPQYVEYCREIGNGYDIDYWILVALIEKESSGIPDVADYYDGTHIGLMQLSIYYFGGEGIDLTDPYTNIMLGTQYLASLYEDVNDIGIALMRYHGEADALTKPLSGYASWIINRANALRRSDLLGKHIVDEGSNKGWKEMMLEQ